MDSCEPQIVINFIFERQDKKVSLMGSPPPTDTKHIFIIQVSKMCTNEKENNNSNKKQTHSGVLMEKCCYYVMSGACAPCAAAEHPAASPTKSTLTRHADFPITPRPTALHATGSN